MNNKLIKFINEQTHYKAGEDLDIARNNTLIFGTYNPPKIQDISITTDSLLIIIKIIF